MKSFIRLCYQIGLPTTHSQTSMALGNISPEPTTRINRMMCATAQPKQNIYLYYLNNPRIKICNLSADLATLKLNVDIDLRTLISEQLYDFFFMNQCATHNLETCTDLRNRYHYTRTGCSCSSVIIQFC